jgi:signal peptidase I
MQNGFEKSDVAEAAPAEQFQRRQSPALHAVVNTLELVLVAMIFAFTFRTFIMEAFQIPTGSMAQTLRGAHFHLRCTKCGFKYDYTGDSYLPPQPQCPNCRYYMPQPVAVPISNGDRIFVFKSGYHFYKPKRWDVVVFKNPNDPQEAYIKRVIAIGGERVQIIDGDVYINGQIARKPEKVQETFWTCVYDNDYHPFEASAGSSLEVQKGDDNAELLSQPFRNRQGSRWNLDADGPGVFALDGSDNEINTIFYDTSAAGLIRANYAYNDSKNYQSRPVCSDLKVCFYISSDTGRTVFGAILRKYETIYLAFIDTEAGTMTINSRSDDGQVRELAVSQIRQVDMTAGVRFEFANIDHQLMVKFGQDNLSYDIGQGPAAAGEVTANGLEPVEIFGKGQMQLRHIRLFRDMHYISSNAQRAAAAGAFELGADEFFVCGDNSPDSFDSRMWQSRGIGNNSVTYNEGVVPSDYLVGKAVFVYWANASRPFETLLPIIPDLSQVHFIQSSGR